ncbi:peptidase M16, partial [Vibrio xuii]
DRIQQPMVMIGWPTTYRGEETQASLNALANIFGSGANSLLYQKLVKTEKAVDAGAFHDCAELACNFYLYAMAPSGEQGKLQPLYQEMMQVMQDFEAKGVEQQRLDQITGSAEAGAAFALQNVKGKVSQLASNQTFYNQPDRLQTQLEQIRAVSPESVMQAYKDYVNGHKKVTLSVVPKGKTEFSVAPATFETPERTLPEYVKTTEADLDYRRAEDNFDRAVVPKVAQAVKAQMPPLYKLYFDNGAELLGAVSSETPTVQINIRLPAGERYVAEGQEGLANLTAAMMQEGTLDSSVEELQARLDKLGSTVSVSAENYTTSIRISSLKKNLTQTLSIAEEILFTPAFKESDFKRNKKQMLEGIVYQHQKPGWLASQATRQVLFSGSVYQRSNDGSADSIRGLTLEDIKA